MTRHTTRHQFLRLAIIALLTLIAGNTSQAAKAGSIGRDAVRDILSELDLALAGRDDFIAGRQNRIDSLRLSLSRSATDSLTALMRLADEYTAFNNDAALRYLHRGIDAAANPADALPFRWKYASLLPLSGMVDEALKAFSAIDPDSVPDDMLASYYDAGRQMHSYIASFYSPYTDIADFHSNRALDYQLKLLGVLPDNSVDHNFNLGEYYFLTGRKKLAHTLLDEIVDKESPDSNLRARAAHHLSSMARDDGDDNAYIYYLAISAIADLKAATREVASLQELGEQIYAAGDIPRAHQYLSTALANAVECGAALRMVQTARALPIIERAHSNSIDRWRKAVYLVIAVMTVLVIVLVVVMFILRHEMARMRLLQNSLRSANKVKEVYISQFLQLCSIYMDKLNRFCKIANRKIAAGQVDELYRMTRSGKFVEEQSREFYEVFDNAFLHIYPDFVTDVNRLLLPDRQITLRDDELLNTDLRILAFMRLGIEESARIAQVLNYSLNTIYAYRNRLKARAVNRDTFENEVMKIGSAS